MSDEPKRGRGRLPGFKMTEEHRSKIRSAQLLNALQEHALGTREMGSTQVAAATVLLKKVMPDLSAADVTSRTETAKPEEMDDNALAARIAELRAEDKDANQTEH